MDQFATGDWYRDLVGAGGGAAGKAVQSSLARRVRPEVLESGAEPFEDRGSYGERFDLVDSGDRPEQPHSSWGRRQLLSAAACTGAGLVLGRTLGAESKQEKLSDVSATEDLMRAHGLLNRVLIIYEEEIRRGEMGKLPRPEVFAVATRIIQRFVVNYHEKLEEQEVFPRLEKAGKLVELVRVLRQQHTVGRRLTGEILKNSNRAGLTDRKKFEALVHSVEALIRMYRAHEAREDTDLLPAFHSLFTQSEFDRVGQEFEHKQLQALGGAGFEGILTEVSQLEKMLDIHQLSLFTASA